MTSLTLLLILICSFYQLKNYSAHPMGKSLSTQYQSTAFRDLAHDAWQHAEKAFEIVKSWLETKAGSLFQTIANEKAEQLLLEKSPCTILNQMINTLNSTTDNKLLTVLNPLRLTHIILLILNDRINY